MKDNLKFTADGFLKSSYLTSEGQKIFKIEHSAKDNVDLAKVELMSRDLTNHLPVLLKVTYEISPKKKLNKTQQEPNEKPNQKAEFRGRKTADS